MRLTCPNCSAQYEVDESVIPKAGRDVQCSACGNTWFQYPMEVALQMRAAEMEDDDDEDEDFDDEDNGRPLGATMGERAAPRIDKTVLDVLREEADREMGERKRAQGAIETQGDLGLTRPTRSKAAPSRVFGEDDPTPPPVDAVPDDAPVSDEPVKRRSLLPDIEELTSTLEPGSERRGPDDAADAAIASEQKGFRRGLSLIMLVAIALAVVYLLAPLIANTVPALRAPLATYVGVIDSARIAVANLMRGLFGG